MAHAERPDTQQTSTNRLPGNPAAPPGLRTLQSSPRAPGDRQAAPIPHCRGRLSCRSSQGTERADRVPLRQEHIMPAYLSRGCMHVGNALSRTDESFAAHRRPTRQRFVPAWKIRTPTPTSGRCCDSATVIWGQLRGDLAVKNLPKVSQQGSRLLDRRADGQAGKQSKRSQRRWRRQGAGHACVAIMQLIKHITFQDTLSVWRGARSEPKTSTLFTALHAGYRSRTCINQSESA